VLPSTFSKAQWPVSRGHTAIAVLALALYGIAYVPSYGIPFRVEELDIYHFYATTEFDPLSAYDWGLMAFWTPFYDFRMLPLSYLWNFGVFTLLGTSTLKHWILSVALDLVNAALVARWVSLRLGKKFEHGLIAAAFFLLLPAKHEIVLWSFFTYKLIHTTVVLACLIQIERFFQDRHRTHLVWGLVLMFLSWFFYEASLGLGMVLPLGMILLGGFSRREAARAAVLVAIPYVVYIALYLIARAVVPSLYALVLPGDSVYIQPFSVVDLWLSLRSWVTHGMLLANSGLPLTTDTEFIPTSIAIHVLPTFGWVMVVGTVWTMFASQIVWRAAGWRSIAYIIGVGAILNVLVLVGRTSTNGVNYLAHFSMYQYLPSLIIAAILGGMAENSIDAPRVLQLSAPQLGAPRRARILLATSICLVLLGTSSTSAVRAYMKVQGPLAKIFDHVERRCKNEGTRVSVAGILLPFSPDTFIMPPEDHAYHALSLLNGDCIVPVPSQQRSSAAVRVEPTSIAVRQSARFGDWLELLGYDMPAMAPPRGALSNDALLQSPQACIEAISSFHRPGEAIGPPVELALSDLRLLQSLRSRPAVVVGYAPLAQRRLHP